MTVATLAICDLLQQELVRQIGEPRYQLWFAGKSRFRVEGTRVLVGVANHFLQEWLQAKFGDAIRAAATVVIGQDPELRFKIDPELFQESRQAQAEAIAKPAPSEPEASPKPKREDRPARKWHRLVELVVGPCNRVAHAAALSMVEQPEEASHPLVLHGPVGTGKTHLLEGIYAGLRERHPEWRILFVSAEEFTNRFVQAMRLGKLGSFRKHYREAEVLLLDDLHFLASKKATQEEFLHTFDTLNGLGRPVVVTTDCHPRLADDFTPELVDRLLGGAIWPLQPPTVETRLKILKLKSQSLACTIPDDVLRYVSDRLQGNVRELEGALQCLKHYSQVTGKRIDRGLAAEALAELLRHSVKIVRLEDVDLAVCQVLRLPEGSLQSRQRAWAISHARMVAMFLARKHTSAAYSEIGKHFGKRNHSTVVAAEKKVRSWLAKREEISLGSHKVVLQDLVERIERALEQ